MKKIKAFGIHKTYIHKMKNQLQTSCKKCNAERIELNFEEFQKK